jgi:hypothetical protein
MQLHPSPDLNLGPSTLILIPASSDQIIVRPLLFLALTATLATAESHPSWWAYASPEATALVGIQWDNLRHSPFAAAIEAEISPSGALGFPDLECLRQAREIVISAPAFLAAEAGSFPAATVSGQAQRQGLQRSTYRGATLWLPPQAGKPGIAQISEQLVLVGARKTLETAIDRGISETGRPDSPLLIRASLFAQTGDLWVVAARLPDPLAGLFVPLDAPASEFLGQVSLRNGLVVQASFDAGSEKAAAEFAKGIREKAPTFPAVARGLEAAADQSRVTIALQVNSEDLTAATSAPARAHLPEPVSVVALAAPPEGSSGPLPDDPQLGSGTEQLPASPFKFEITHIEASQPRIIRIFNLEGGTREITLPIAH